MLKEKVAFVKYIVKIERERLLSTQWKGMTGCIEHAKYLTAYFNAEVMWNMEPDLWRMIFVYKGGGDVSFLTDRGTYGYM